MATKKVFEIEIDGVKEAITNVNALKEAQQKLAEAFEKAEFGSEQYANLAGQLQEVNSKLKVIDESVADITGAEKVEGFVRLGNGIVGAFSTASIAAQAFGESGEDIEKVTMKLQQTIVVFQGLQAIQEAVGRENKLVTSLMNRFGAAQEAATASTGKLTVAQRLFNLVARANPIGLIITALGILIGLVALVANNWDQIRKKFAPVFEFIESAFNYIIDLTRDFLSLITGGLINDAATAKTIANAEKMIAAIEKSQKVYDQLRARQEFNIEVLEAVGGKEREIFEARVKLAERDLELLGQRQDQLIALFRLGEKEIEIEGEKKQIIDVINANTQKTLELQNQIRILGINEQKRLEEAAKKTAEERLALLKEQLKGIDTLKQRLTLEEAIFTEQAKMLVAQEKINGELKKGKQAQVDVIETNKAAYEQAEKRLKELRELTDKPLIPKIPTDAVKPIPIEVEPFVDTRTFKEKIKAQLEEPGVKEMVGQIFSDLFSSGVNLMGTLFQNTLDRMQGGLDFLRTQLEDTDKAIEESNDKANKLEDDLANSRGQRREYLIEQIENERKREKDLEKQKAAQAKEEKKRLDELAKEKRKQALIQKGIDIGQAIARAALAVIGFLANPGYPLGVPLSIAAGALGALQVATIAATKYARGGFLKKLFSRGDMLTGPSHAEGGIPFTIDGRPGFEAEGGEAIINKRSAAAFRDQLSAINSYNGWGKKFETGGVLTPAPIVNTVNLNNDALLQEMKLLRAETARINSTPVRIGVDQITQQQQRNAEIEAKGTI